MTINKSATIIIVSCMSLAVAILLLQNVSANGANLKLLSAIPNDAHKLTLKYYVDSDDYQNNELKSIHPEKVTLVKNKTEIEYKPIDHDSLFSSGSYYKPVWSPDKNYLVLPLGMFDGFVIYESAKVWNNISKAVYPTTIKARLSIDSPDLAHMFIKWEDDNTFVFKAGLSGDDEIFRYNLGTGEAKGKKPFEVVISSTNKKVVKF